MPFRYTNRSQDAKTWNEKKGPFVEAFNNVETSVNHLLDGWLQNPRNGMLTRLDTLVANADDRVL